MNELPENLDLINPEFIQAWNLIRHTNKSVFLTGKAGTGKSTFLRYICKNTKKKYVVLAPTGIAAVNVGGVTLHSFFHIPLRPIPPDDPDYTVSRILRKLKLTKEQFRVIKNVELIIIDEVSMVRPDIIDFIDRLLQAVTGIRREPFGGKQLLLVGDIFQLEPVVTSDTRTILSRYYTDFFFFNALAYSRIPLVSIELKKVYRQSDPSFISMLDRIRVNKASGEDLRRLNSRLVSVADAGTDSSDEFVMTLASRRGLADAINSRMMQQNPNPETVFIGKIEGDFPERSLPTDLNLAVKKDEQIILIKNDKDKRWVNGTLARVEAIENDSIRIILEDGSTHTLEREVWDNVKYTFDENEKKVNEEIIGRFIQFPIKAAWALTVHKSQGLTFNKVSIELGDGAFSAGQTYVALSRCRSFEGLRFHSPISRRDVIVSRGAVEFSSTFNDASQVNGALEEARTKILLSEANEAFDSRDMRTAVEKAIEGLPAEGKPGRALAARFISRRLLALEKAEAEVREMKGRMASLASEFVRMGNECLKVAGAEEAAISNFDKALTLDPSCPEAIEGRIRTLISTRRLIEASSALELADAARSLPTFSFHFLDGMLAQAIGAPDKALVSFQQASDADKGNAEVHDRMADILDKLDFPDMAETHREKARKLRKRKRR